MKKLLLVLIFMGFMGCRQPFDKPVYVEWGSSVTPFLLQLEGDQKQATVETSDLLDKSMIGGRRIQITYHWVKTGRDWGDGQYYPDQRLILVDREQCTREWTTDAHSGTSATNQAIQLESKDSINFSTNLSITCKIVDNADAKLFLFNYPAGKVEKIPLKDSSKDDYEVKKVDLASVIDSEVRARCQKVLQEFCNDFNLQELRGKKGEMIKALEGDVVKFFKTRGVTITTLAMSGGMHYANPNIQQSIDKVFQAQMDKDVAEAEIKAAEQRKLAKKALGEGEAAMAMAKAEGEAKAIQTIADAKAYELKKLQENPSAYLALKTLELQKEAIKIWDGKWPIYYMGSNNAGPNVLMQLPSLGQTPKEPKKEELSAEKK